MGNENNSTKHIDRIVARYGEDAAVRRGDLDLSLGQLVAAYDECPAQNPGPKAEVRFLLESLSAANTKLRFLDQVRLNRLQSD